MELDEVILRHQHRGDSHYDRERAGSRDRYSVNVPVQQLRETQYHRNDAGEGRPDGQLAVQLSKRNVVLDGHSVIAP